MSDSSVKLLIVDDEPGTRSLMSQIFARKGHAVRVAEDGFTALDVIRHDPPDVILSDLNMPGMSGFELLSVVRRRFPGIQVIAMSGAFSGESVQPGVAADAFYEKASGIPSLLQIMDALTNPQRLAGGLRRQEAPFWIQRDEDSLDGKTYVTISCPECLRTFPLLSGKPVGNINIHEIPCVYCDTMIHFAIVQPSSAAHAASPQAFQRKSVAVVVSPLELPLVV